MSQENVEIVRSMCAGFSELAQGGELASFVAEHWDPDCEYQPVEETITIHGHGAFIRWAERWLEAWGEYWDEIDEIIDVGESVVASITVHGRGRDSRLEISQRFFHVIELRDHKILRMREYLDRDQALEAAGLREQTISENVEIVRRYYSAWNAGGIDAARAFWSDEIE